MKRLSVIGAGHVGLTSAVCYASRGFKTVLCEKDVRRLDLLRRGIAPFHEPGLNLMLRQVAASGSLTISESIEHAVRSSEVAFVAVGTPSKSDGNIDLSSIEDVCGEIGMAIKAEESYRLVAIRSTVIPGTTEGVAKVILENRSDKRAGRDFGLAMQPEFLREGAAVEDTLNPNRVIIGEYDKESGDVLESLYHGFYKNRVPPILRMNLASAEMVKYASNGFLAAKISFINEVARICERIKGVDITLVADGMGLDDRIGRKFLDAGPGFGGSCFGKDLNAIVTLAEKAGCEAKLLRAILDVNGRQALHMVELARRELGNLRDSRIAVLGLSFKPNTDDIRDAPALRIIDRLLKEGASVTVHDPAAMSNVKEIYEEKVDYADSALECISNADCTIVVTEWDTFRKLTVEDFKKHMRKPFVIDCRRIYDPLEFRTALKYSAVGLAPL
jgi:UDPglucose 6-dehydrogenase